MFYRDLTGCIVVLTNVWDSKSVGMPQDYPGHAQEANAVETLEAILVPFGIQKFGAIAVHRKAHHQQWEPTWKSIALDKGGVHRFFSA